MLEEEGFTFDRYIDIFDGGPTVTAPTDDPHGPRSADARRSSKSAMTAAPKMLVAPAA
jgi:arginine N-succinyltransferase